MFSPVTLHVQDAESVSAGAGPAAAGQVELSAAANAVPWLRTEHVVSTDLTCSSGVGFGRTPDAPDNHVDKNVGRTTELAASPDKTQEHKKERETESRAGGGRGGRGRSRS